MKHSLDLGIEGTERTAWCTCGAQCPERPAIVSRVYIWWEDHVAEVNAAARTKRRRRHR